MSSNRDGTDLQYTRGDECGVPLVVRIELGAIARLPRQAVWAEQHPRMGRPNQEIIIRLNEKIIRNCVRGDLSGGKPADECRHLLLCESVRRGGAPLELDHRSLGALISRVPHDESADQGIVRGRPSQAIKKLLKIAHPNDPARPLGPEAP
jgi:hypothetical protein